MEKIAIQDLASKVVGILEARNYAYGTICGHRAAFRKICGYAQTLGEEYFSEELGRDYLKWAYGYIGNYYEESYPQRIKHAIRAVRLLGDYQLHGVIVARIAKRPGYTKPPQFQAILDSYEKECEDNQYSYRGMRTRLQRLYFFIDYLAQRQLMDVHDITPEIIADYVITISPRHEKSIAAILTTLRVFLRFLYQNSFTDTDLSLHVPKQKRYNYPPIPQTWEPDKVRKILEAVDRNSPLGKRDYAILLMVTRLGMRIGDLKALLLSQLDWQNKIITIVQEKTKNTVTYPILHDIGWALIDYLQQARPVTEAPQLFVNLRAPYMQFGENANLHNIITKYIRLAGIKIPRGKPHGMHSLRHTLASTLIEQGATFTEISEILGHTNIKSTAVYLHIDFKGLKNCALDPEGVFLDD